MEYDRIKCTVTITHVGADTCLAYTVVPASLGKLVRYVAVIPTYTTTTVTTTLHIHDVDGNLVYSGAAHAHNATYSVAMDVDLHPGDYLELVTSADIGDTSNKTAYLYLYMER
jgi:hypothetical protein